VDRIWLKLWRARGEDPLQDAETLKLDSEGNIIELGRRPQSYDQIQGQYMGLIKVRADFAPELVRIYRHLDPVRRYEGKDLRNIFMTAFLEQIIAQDHPLRAVQVESGWLEVDSVSDLLAYQRMAEEGTLGEFWRPVAV
jgi:L-glutamine-phosphate cytidylyltransferase